MNGPELLAAHTGILRTKIGACWPGTRAVFRGHDLHRDLRNSDWMDLYIFGITGRRFTSEQIKLLHGIWVTTSYPDTRIWNNRVAGLAGNARSTPVLGITAALAVSEAWVYGGVPGVKAIDFFQRAGKAVAEGREIRVVVEEELANRKVVFGFGRPIDSRDERLAWLADIAKSLGLGEGRHFKLAFKIESILLDMGKSNLLMNYAGMTAALGADLGLTPREFHIFRVPMFLAGMAPCWQEAAEKPEGTLFPTPCGGIAYEGVAQRTWRGKIV
jgi:hypothetical protein